MTNSNYPINIFERTPNSEGVECKLEGITCPQYDSERSCVENCPNRGYNNPEESR